MRTLFATPALLVLACAPRPRQPPDAPGVMETAESGAAADPDAEETPRHDLVEELHGHRVADPYRWLEDGKAPEVVRWVQRQNERTAALLSSVPGRDALEARLLELLRIGDVSRPVVRKAASGEARYFYTRREGDQNQPVLLVRDGSGAQERILFDPNALSTDGTLALDWYYPSGDGALVAYGTSANGSERSTLRVRDVSSGEDLPDVIPHTRQASVCWRQDGSGFYYARYPEPGTVPEGDEAYYRRIHLHELGRPPADDPLVFGAHLRRTDYPTCALSPDGRWLVIHVHQGWSKSELYLADTRAPALTFRRLTNGSEHVYGAIARDDTLYVWTDEGAPRYRLFAVDPNAPERPQWRLVLAEHPEDVLKAVSVVGGQILALYLHEATSRLERFAASGESLGAVSLPGPGSSGGFSGAHDGREAFFDFQSFTRPVTIRRIDLDSGATETWAEVASTVDPERYEVSHGQARSKDGTAVPYFTVRSRSAPRGPGPTLLYGYGGFNITLQPRFKRSMHLLLERGGTYVQANLRGGGEFGEAWHRGGWRDKKQNVFDDFFAVAEHLVATGTATPSKLAILGRSNGGLLVAAAITQRPELFRAAVASVPLTDMVRYHRFQLGRLWIPEYGDPEVAEELAWLLAYSPYHRVRPATPYPAVLLTTASEDTRVDPMHARKMTAALQHATSSGRPILLRSETEAGHGAGKPITKIAAEYADIYAFVLKELGLLAAEKP